MALLPKVKLKAMLSFPSAIIDGAGIDVHKINGAFKLDLAFDDFAPPVSGIADPAHTNALLWNNVTNTYVLAPVNILGSAGTVPEAPNDGVQYGRQSNTWTSVSTGSTVPPATVLPIMDGTAAIGTTTKYAREDHVHPSDTSRAATVHTHVAANVTDFSEAVDDRVSVLLQAGSNIALTYDDPGGTLTVASTAPALADGDKGDITVSLSGTQWTIDANAVSNAKLAQMPLFTIKANNTGFSAVPTDINIASLTSKTPASADYLLLSDTSASGALKKTLISAMPGATSIGEAPTDGALYSRQGSTGSWAVAGGFPDGDKGDITITSSGTVWTIDADAVTFAKIQNIATDSLIGRDTTGTGDPENIALGTSLSMNGAQVLQRAALTGDVTATVDSNATTIANGAVSLGKMANLTAPVFVGRTTAGAGVPEALTPTQATAMLNVFASSLKGLVPSPAGATTTFLKADGTWAAPPSPIIYVSDTPPAAADNSLWWDSGTDSGQLYVRYNDGNSSQWVVAVPQSDSARIPGANAVINGDFRVNQVGYVSAAALSAGTYGHDQWKAGASGGDYSFTQLKSSTQITIASGKSLIQPIEDANVVGGSYVLSWSGTAQARAGVNTLTPSGSYAASPLAITGQTAGTVMSVEFNTGTLGTVKLESGTSATPFIMRPYDQELLTCMRYYYKRNSGLGGYGLAGTFVNTWQTHQVAMRASPTMSVTGGSYTNASGAVVDNATTLSFRFYMTITSTNFGQLDAATITADARL